MSPLDFHGYCNKLYRLDYEHENEDDIDEYGNSASSYIVKLYSKVAKIRMTADNGKSSAGEMDIYFSRLSLGPRVIYSDSDGLVMDFMDGVTLDESNIHGKYGNELCEQLGHLVSDLHSHTVTAIEEGSYVTLEKNMLWLTLDRMMNNICYYSNEMPFPKGWTFEKVVDEIDFVRNAIDPLNLPQVLSHGDLKPTNVMLLREESSSFRHKVSFVDFEISGLNYRGYDIYKLFRTSNSSKYSSNNMEVFIKSYVEWKDSKNQAARGQLDACSILKEAQLFESITVSYEKS